MQLHSSSAAQLPGLWSGPWCAYTLLAFCSSQRPHRHSAHILCKLQPCGASSIWEQHQWIPAAKFGGRVVPRDPEPWGQCLDGLNSCQLEPGKQAAGISAAQQRSHRWGPFSWHLQRTDVLESIFSWECIQRMSILPTTAGGLCLYSQPGCMHTLPMNRIKSLHPSAPAACPAATEIGVHPQRSCMQVHCRLSWPSRLTCALSMWRTTCSQP